MSRHLAPAALACLALLGPLPQAASANEAKFRITASWIVNYIEPQQRSAMVNYEYTVILREGGKIEERVVSRVGQNWRGDRLMQAEASLGNGVRPEKIWKVVNETTLVRLVARNSHTFAIWLRTQGKDSCSATLEWRLKPGFTAFEEPQKPGKPVLRFSEHSWLNVRCDVL